MTKQEMFNRAYLGLASQGWRRAVNTRGMCVHQTADGRRCGWGWVDTGLGPGDIGSVEFLAERGVGLAASLDSDHLAFAMCLQATHDGPGNSDLRIDMERLAVRHSLAIPELP